MERQARQALAAIQAAVAEGRYVTLVHFLQRMDQRGLFWPDVLALIEDPAQVHGDGLDAWSRPRWILSGRAADGLDLEIVCVLDSDEAGRLVVFITIYWQESS